MNEQIKKLLLNGYQIFMSHNGINYYVRMEAPTFGREWMTVDKSLDGAIEKMYIRANQAGALQGD